WQLIAHGCARAPSATRGSDRRGCVALACRLQLVGSAWVVVVGPRCRAQPAARDAFGGIRTIVAVWRCDLFGGNAMTANTKSMLLLAMTLVTGFALGLFADASLVRGRRDRIDGMRRPPGFVEHLESVIQPHSDAQRDSIRPILEAVARNNQQAIRDVNVRLRAALDSMKTALSPMLDES